MASLQRYKITLSSSKVVILNAITIAMKNSAVEAAAQKSNGAGRGFDALLQDELLRQTIYKINGNIPSGAEREDLDKLLSFAEYSEVMQGMTEVMGLDVAKKPKIEVLTGES